VHIHPLDTFQPRESVVHELDARVKLVTALLLIIATALTPDGAWIAYILIWLLILAIVFASRLGVIPVLRRSLIALPFTLAALPILFSTPGDALLVIPMFSRRLALSGAGLVRFSSILLKSWFSVQVAVVLTGSTSFPLLLQAMRSLRMPKVLVAVAGFTYRYIFVIADETMRLMRARSARSAAYNGKGGRSVLWRASVTGNMAGSMFLRSLERSERIYAAMVSRGYNGEIRSLSAPELGVSDVLLCLPVVAALVLIQVMARLWL